MVQYQSRSQGQYFRVKSSILLQAERVAFGIGASTEGRDSNPGSRKGWGVQSADVGTVLAKRALQSFLRRDSFLRYNTVSWEEKSRVLEDYGSLKQLVLRPGTGIGANQDMASLVPYTVTE